MNKLRRRQSVICPECLTYYFWEDRINSAKLCHSGVPGCSRSLEEVPVITKKRRAKNKRKFYIQMVRLPRCECGKAYTLYHIVDTLRVELYHPACHIRIKVPLVKFYVTI